MRTIFAWCCQMACHLLGWMLLSDLSSLSLISGSRPDGWKLSLGMQRTFRAGNLIREKASWFDAAAFAGSSWCLHFSGVVNVDFIACEPILLVLIRKRGVHKVCHISVGTGITTANYRTISMLGRELAVCGAGLLDDIRSVLLLAFIFINPFTSRIPLSLCLFRYLGIILSLICCIKLHWGRVPIALLKVRHTYVRIFWQFGHHEIDDLGA